MLYVVVDTRCCGIHVWMLDERSGCGWPSPHTPKTAQCKDICWLWLFHMFPVNMIICHLSMPCAWHAGTYQGCRQTGMLRALFDPFIKYFPPRPIPRKFPLSLAGLIRVRDMLYCCYIQCSHLCNVV